MRTAFEQNRVGFCTAKKAKAPQATFPSLVGEWDLLSSVAVAWGV